jgi:hypothetical protein
VDLDLTRDAVHIDSGVFLDLLPVTPYMLVVVSPLYCPEEGSEKSSRNEKFLRINWLS